MPTSSMENYREFLKDNIRLQADFSQTAQNRGVPPPPLEKPCSSDAVRFALPGPEAWKTIGQVDVLTAIQRRRSRRDFRKEPLTLEELAFLLWTTQGITRQVNPAVAFRTVPSAGCRHALET
ncbi:SagB/ThcOx family dehydrogenase, partial [candidate division KSB3 bacterium]|nr:SagB/ThcOx family dehydrogenase [candidate division KSB3 bacterium]MBD3325780.1 SagB/ThcOx family dehydrogenase [candidate division KSB3 bacterium]